MTSTAGRKRRNSLIAIETIASRIALVRGQKVMLDADLAALYGVETRRLNEQVRRNAERFPADFMFSLTNQDLAALRSQIAILKTGRSQHRKYPPYALTEHGAIMAAMVLNSTRATEVSVYVVRAFVQQHDLLVAHKELARRLGQLESRIERKLEAQDDIIFEILAAIRQLMAPREPRKKRPIGFITPEEK